MQYVLYIAKKTLPLPFNETERNGSFPFNNISLSVLDPCVFSVRFGFFLIYFRVAQSALVRGSL